MPLKNETVADEAASEAQVGLQRAVRLLAGHYAKLAANHPHLRAYASVADDLMALLDECGRAGDEPAVCEPEPLPAGRWARVELPGFRNHTGWITEETRFGQQVLVVRDWCGAEVADVILGPMCQVVYLPTPQRRPEPRAALPAAGDAGVWDAEYAEDEQSGSPF